MADDPRSEPGDGDIRDVVVRLARPRAGGGYVIERAAILAAGSDSALIEAWILDHAGRPEEQTTATTAGGLHGGRLDATAAPRGLSRRFVLPPDALGALHDPSHSPP